MIITFKLKLLFKTKHLQVSVNSIIVKKNISAQKSLKSNELE